MEQWKKGKGVDFLSRYPRPRIALKNRAVVSTWSARRKGDEVRAPSRRGENRGGLGGGVPKKTFGGRKRSLSCARRLNAVELKKIYVKKKVIEDKEVNTAG